jgi:serine protease Do
MSTLSPIHKGQRAPSTRRIILFATVANVAVVALAAGFTGVYQAVPPLISNAEAAVDMGQRSAGFGDLVEKVKPAVFSVRVKLEASTKTATIDGKSPTAPSSPMDQFFRRFGMPDGGSTPEDQHQLRDRPVTAQGSGFFISSDGYAVTNNHVVENARTVEVRTDDAKIYSAKVIGTDPRTDLALIKVDGRSDFPYVKLADKAPRIGDWVLAVGNPFGLGGTVTAGIVSARGRDIGAGPYDDFIQIDASVNKGNSGGPTFDMDGDVIGVNTAIFSPSGGSVGIAFDIPSETVKAVVAQLKDKGVVSRGWVGVQIQPVTAEIAEGLDMKGSEGALVDEAQAGSPAANAGVLSGDVITAVNGHPVRDARDLAKQIGAMAPGAAAKLTLWRTGGEKTVSMMLAELPKEREARASTSDHSPTGTDVPKLGLMLAPAGQVAGSRPEGVVVTAVDPDGLASEHGFKIGDVILDVGGKKVATAADVRDALGDAQTNGKRTVLMRLRSDDATRFVAISIAPA